ncbi:nicotinate-nucleotide adenylyltransferase [Seongchinamella sediminis]|uniref:Probable nicotinate-nucleotide adenylyltransferase n=1 Tax=Seongchinamella sediminis TaxID=2283635 RepID=A0A3L7DZG8_9GAMM|nr:nicotinate-nucleotide adenylyltransferase [Seongchinamella sediminis]RLQ21242.1 nicotinate-nucleotide adenylyltransferase [Seongchinamella sediminis]
MSQSLTPVGVFGGTFNPVHYGHLRSALELCELLELDRLGLMPCAQPPHREAPDCSAEQRAAMVELAVQDEPRLCCDRRELAREGVSYTVLSLEELRAELGPGCSLALVLGCDALLNIDSWYRWQELLELAHIVVIARPGWHFPDSGVVADWLAAHRSDDRTVLRQRSHGHILVEELRPLAISSTEIRDLLRAGRSPRYLLPGLVLDYIERGQLYR